MDKRRPIISKYSSLMPFWPPFCKWVCIIFLLWKVKRLFIQSSLSRILPIKWHFRSQFCRSCYQIVLILLDLYSLFLLDFLFAHVNNHWNERADSKYEGEYNPNYCNCLSISRVLRWTYDKFEQKWYIEKQLSFSYKKYLKVK